MYLPMMSGGYSIYSLQLYIVQLYNVAIKTSKYSLAHPFGEKMRK